jgi:hypothetical protein
MEEEGSRQFLPPQAPGPEPELGERPAQEPPAWQAPAHSQAPVQQPQQQQQHAYPQQPPQPDNGPAVAGFVLSTVSGSLLVVSAGLSSIVSVACAILGIVYSRKGRKRMREGITTKNGSLAQAGFIVGIVSLCLAALATLLWTVVLLDPEARDDLEREFDDSETIRAVVRLAVAFVA